MYHLIAVPVEGTTLDEQALLWAIAIARKAACGIELVRVIAPPAYTAPPVLAATPSIALDLEQVRKGAERVLRHKAGEVARSLGQPVHHVIVDGVLPDALESYLEQGEADLVVMGTHDRGRLERMLLGSSTDSVVRHVHRPVLVVHGESSELPRAPQIQHILIPLDGSPFAEQILPYARTLAQLMGARVTLLSVLEPMLFALEAAAEQPALVEAVDPSAESNPLDASAQALRAAGLAVATHVVVDRQPGHVINEFARQHQVDVIAMTSHGRGGLGRLIAGSVALKVVHGGSTAVLLYRPETS